MRSGSELFAILRSLTSVGLASRRRSTKLANSRRIADQRKLSAGGRRPRNGIMIVGAHVQLFNGSPATPGPAPRFHYAWIDRRRSPFVVLIVTAGIRATPGVLMVPLEAEFGWSRAAISRGGRHQHRAVRADRAVCGLGDEPWGMRRLILAAIALLAVSVALTHADAAPVADDAAVGHLRRHRHRGHLDGPGRGRGDALVRGAARASCSARSRRRTPPGS